MRDRLVDLVESARYWGANTSEEIANYLLENGVVVPPVKVGQTIYLLWAGGRSGKAVVEAKIININLDCHDDMEIVYRIYSHKTTMCRYAKVSDFGNTLFITREEAERALGRGNND